MPRYIDVDVAIKLHEGELWAWDVYDLKEFLAEVPTADVVPKSEVEKAIDDLKRYIIINEDISKKCKLENGEQNEEYWKGKLSALLQIRGYLDSELKKKYTEGEQDVQT